MHELWLDQRVLVSVCRGADAFVRPATLRKQKESVQRPDSPMPRG